MKKIFMFLFITIICNHSMRAQENTNYQNIFNPLFFVAYEIEKKNLIQIRDSIVLRYNRCKILRDNHCMNSEEFNMLEINKNFQHLEIMKFLFEFEIDNYNPLIDFLYRSTHNNFLIKLNDNNLFDVYYGGKLHSSSVSKKELIEQSRKMSGKYKNFGILPEYFNE